MIQIRLWEDCNNNCSFCSLGVQKGHLLLESKISRIKKLIDVSDDTISLIGGEFFEGQLFGCENIWLKTISKLSCNRLFISANLIHQQYLLKETLAIRPDILLCTSYDTVGRFHTNSLRLNWLERVGNLIPNVFCTIIPTQDIFSDIFIDKIPCDINLCEPHLGISWLRSVDKSNYHENLVSENKIFNLPKRRDFLTWLSKRPKLVNRLLHYRECHFNDIISFDRENNFCYEEKNRFHNQDFIAPCGHPWFSRCYADSDNCLLCDLEEFY